MIHCVLCFPLLCVSFEVICRTRNRKLTLCGLNEMKNRESLVEGALENLWFRAWQRPFKELVNFWRLDLGSSSERTSSGAIASVRATSHTAEYRNCALIRDQVLKLNWNPLFIIRGYLFHFSTGGGGWKIRGAEFLEYVLFITHLANHKCLIWACEDDAITVEVM